jgi:hypothetical protein
VLVCSVSLVSAHQAKKAYRIFGGKSPHKSHPGGCWVITFRFWPIYSRGKEFPNIHWTGDGVGFRAHLDLVMKEHIQMISGLPVQNPSLYDLNCHKYKRSYHK